MSLFGPDVLPFLILSFVFKHLENIYIAYILSVVLVFAFSSIIVLFFFFYLHLPGIVLMYSVGFDCHLQLRQILSIIIKKDKTHMYSLSCGS